MLNWIDAKAEELEQARVESPRLSRYGTCLRASTGFFGRSCCHIRLLRMEVAAAEVAWGPSHGANAHDGHPTDQCLAQPNRHRSAGQRDETAGDRG